MFCQSCGSRLDGAAVCPSCGLAVGSEQPQTSGPGGWDPPVAPATSSGSAFSTAGIVCGALAFLLVPIVLGPLGIIFGVIGLRRGERLGMVAVVVGAAGLVVGMILGYLVFSSTT